MKYVMILLVFLVSATCVFAVESFLSYGAVEGDLDLNLEANHSALKQALSDTTQIYIPEGSYKVQANDGDNFTPRGGTVIRGAGADNTELVFQTQSTAWTYIFGIRQDGISIKDLTIRIESPEGGRVQIFKMSANNFKLLNSRIQGNSYTHRDRQVHVFFFGHQDTHDILIKDNNFLNVHRVNLRPNDMKGFLSNVQFIDNFFRDITIGGVQFNTPFVSGQDISVIGNTFRNENGGDKVIFVGMASMHGAEVHDNTFYGKGRECIHLEEDTKDVNITGNKCHIDGRGVCIKANNVSGIWGRPHNILIEGNVFSRLAEGVTTAEGILAPNAGAPVKGFANLKIIDNSFRGYRYAMNLDDSTYEVRDNRFLKHLKSGEFHQQCIRLSGSPNSSQSSVIGDNSYDACMTPIYSISQNSTVPVGGPATPVTPAPQPAPQPAPEQPKPTPTTPPAQQQPPAQCLPAWLLQMLANAGLGNPC